MFYMPIINEGDYKAFLEIMRPHMTYTYNEWLNLCSQWSADYASDGIRNISVNPNQFRIFLSATGRAPDINALTICAERIGNGDAY
jgi:hypothetical protein